MCSFGLTIAAVFLATLWTVDGSKSGCPETALGSHHFAKVHNGKCYLFVDHERYWDAANDSCVKMGGEMLSVEDYHTMTFVRSVLNSRQLGWKKRGVWLGARYNYGRWRWSSGKPVGYANWAPGQPGKIFGMFSVEDCALMRRGDNWQWHDYFCSGMKYHFNYICQFPVENSTTTSTTTTTTTSTTAGTSTTSATTAATVFKPGYFSKKGLLADRAGSSLSSHGSHQQEDKMGEERGALDYTQNGAPNHPHGEEGGVPRYPYEHRPAFNDRGHNEVHSTTQVLENGNLTILTIILVTGGIIVLILLLIFLIVRKRYNYKKAVGQPTVYFENRNYNHSHSASGHGVPLPPPPAPHTFHRPSAPPVPPRPLTSLTSRLPHPERPTQTSPHLFTPYVPHSRPSSDLYLTPVDIGAGVGVYEEVRVSKTAAAAHATSGLTATPAGKVSSLGAFGGAYPQDREDSATIPLISASGAPWGQSEESLHSMSGSLTMKTSSIHNDYVDMNGSPVVPARSSREVEAPPKPEERREADPRGPDSVPDPKDELSKDDDCDGLVLPGEGKAPCYPGYSNLMTTSQERCENLYAQLH